MIRAIRPNMHLAKVRHREVRKIIEGELKILSRILFCMIRIGFRALEKRKIISNESFLFIQKKSGFLTEQICPIKIGIITTGMGYGYMLRLYRLHV